jgi:hypothetical protein
MPCAALRSLEARRPHLIEIVDNLRRIHDIGHDRWCAEQAQRWTCPSCGTPAWWYGTTCAACGRPVPVAYEKT